jgi:tetratricopeptide (TPR) repeat protein
VNADNLTKKALEKRTLGKLDEAARLFTEVLATEPRHAGACLGLARLSLELGLAEEAEELLDRVDNQDVDLPESHVLRGLLSEARQDAATALSHHARAVLVGPRDFEAHYQYGRALAEAGRDEAALAELQVAASLDPGAVDPHYAQAMVHVRRGRHGEAVTALARALEVDPNFLDGYITLADVLCLAGNLAAARDALLQARARFPDEGAVHDKLAAVELKVGDLQAAARALEDQVRVTPGAEDGHVNLVAVALAAGDVTQAARAAEELLRLHPESWRAHAIQSTLLDLADKQEAALAEARLAHRYAPHRWEPLNDLGVLLNGRGVKDPAVALEAVEVLRLAVELAPADELAPRYNLALAYWNAGRTEDARRTAEGLVRDGPPSDDVVALARDLLDAIRGAGKARGR